MAGRVCLPRSRFRVGLSLVMWMASATPLRNQSVSCWRMETSLSDNECLRWLRWWPTGEELRWCSETRLRRLLSVSLSTFEVIYNIWIFSFVNDWTAISSQVSVISTLRTWDISQYRVVVLFSHSRKKEILVYFVKNCLEILAKQRV